MGFMADARRKIAKSSKQLLRFDLRFPLDCLCHQRCRCLRNRATFTFKADIADDVVFKVHVHLHFVATKRIETFRLMRRMFEPTKVPGPPAVIDNHFLIEICNFDIAHDILLLTAPFLEGARHRAYTACRLAFALLMLQRAFSRGECRAPKRPIRLWSCTTPAMLLLSQARQIDP